MSTLHATILDAATGEPIAAKVQVLDSTGRYRAPQGSLAKVGPGLPFFYCDGEFSIEVPRGYAQVLVERGTEYVPLRRSFYADDKGAVDLTLALERWTHLPAAGWYPGNTHIHYDQNETAPDARLRLDPQVHAFAVTVVSFLQRRDLAYASNKYAPGLMTELCTAHHVVDIGEESRHNSKPWEFGYGHVLFLRIQRVVEPISRGVLVSDTDPDYPPLCFACDDARTQGGVVLWCHNGRGMEAPVAAALGKLDAFNLFDPQWMDPEYDLWYKLLNCGLRLPASSGSDWFVSSNNRVYVHTGGEFSYDRWLEGMRAGRTFITNGPALFLTVDGRGPGDVVPAGRPCEVSVRWLSHYPLDRVELIVNGDIAQTRTLSPPAANGEWAFGLTLPAGGWLAARAWSHARDSFAQPIYAHTSPIYLENAAPAEVAAPAAAFFVDSIGDSLQWLSTSGRFDSGGQREEIAQLFRAGQEVFARLRA